MTNTIDYENILKQLAELTDAVRQTPRLEMKFDEWRQDFERTLKELTRQQAQRNDAHGHWPRTRDYSSVLSELPANNRYYHVVKQIEETGYYPAGSHRVTRADFLLAHFLLTKARNNYADLVRGPSDDLETVVKALSAGGTGTGAELLALAVSDQLWQDVYATSAIVANMNTIPMPTNPFVIPQGLGNVTWRKGVENAATTASDPGTAKSTLTATELVTEVDWSYTLEEDAVVSLMPALRESLAVSGADIIDAFALNADATNTATGNINSDDAAPSANAYYLTDGQDGLRHLWLIDNTAQGVNANGALQDTHITAALAKMGKYATNPRDLVIVCDIQTYAAGFLSTASGAPGNFVITLDKFGPQAVVLTGQIAAYRGIPVVLSSSAPLTKADGKVSATPANNTKGQVTIFNRRMWYAGFRRDLLVEVERDIQKRQWIMVVSLREAVAAFGPRNTAKHTAGIYNITV